MNSSHGFTINSPRSRICFPPFRSLPLPPLLFLVRLLHREFRLLVKLGLLETNKGNGQRSFSPPRPPLFVENTYTNAHGQTWSAPAFTFSKGASAFPRTGTGHAPLLFHSTYLPLLTAFRKKSCDLPISALTRVNQNELLASSPRILFPNTEKSIQPCFSVFSISRGYFQRNIYIYRKGTDRNIIPATSEREEKRIWMVRFLRKKLKARFSGTQRRRKRALTPPRFEQRSTLLTLLRASRCRA